MARHCPNCNSTVGHCPECGEAYALGETANCPKPACKNVNAPVDCECGLVVSANLDGVLTYDMTLLPWEALS